MHGKVAHIKIITLKRVKWAVTFSGERNNRGFVACADNTLPRSTFINCLLIFFYPLETAERYLFVALARGSLRLSETRTPAEGIDSGA